MLLLLLLLLLPLEGLGEVEGRGQEVLFRSHLVAWVAVAAAAVAAAA